MQEIKETISESKLQLESEKSIFQAKFIDSKNSHYPKTISLGILQRLIHKVFEALNKCKIYFNDETRHYLSGIFLHFTQNDEKLFNCCIYRLT